MAPVAGSSSFQRFFDDLSDAVLCLGEDWRITYANAEACRVSRIAHADINNKTHWELYPETVGSPLEAHYRKVMTTRMPGNIEYNYKPFDLWLDIRASCFDAGIALHYRDISARKRAEALHDASGRQLQQVLGATTDGIVSLSHDWTITYLNRQAETVLGRSDLLGRNLWKEFPLAVGTQFHTRYHQTMEQRVPCEFEEFYPAPLNLWFSIQCRPSDDGIVVFFRDITAERRDRQVLLEQQSTLAFVKETLRAATWTIDLANGNMAIDDGSYPVFGRPNVEITSRESLRSLVHPEDRALLMQATNDALENHTIRSIDYRVMASDGTTLWLEGRGRGLYDEAGNATHLRGMTSDITARKQDEERLAASQARYRVLTELNPQAIWMGSPDGRLTYANQGFIDYTGIPLEELTAGRWIEAFHVDDRQRVLDSWNHAMATGDEYNTDAHLLRASDGTARWWTLRGLPVRDLAGAILYWLGVAYDIDDVRTAAEELRSKQIETERQRAELETVYRTAPAGLGLFDPIDFRYLRINDRLAEIIGRPPEEIIGHTISEIAPAAAQEVLQQVVRDRAAQHRLIEGEFPARPGEIHYFNVNYAPVFAPDGSIQAIATAMLDITHQKKSEAALVQSEKLAAVGRLASSISHEINNPLEAITNLLYLTSLDPDLPEAVKTYVHMAQSELSRVTQIATQTLRFHRQAVRQTFVTAAELVNAVLNLYQGRLTNSGIRISARYSSHTPILCFENDIRQVLNNLIANAIDAMRSGGKLYARAHDSVAPDGRRGVRITIADTGHGMSPDTTARIFEPFYTTKELNGTGLGLWISAGIIHHHKGHLTLRSCKDPARHGTVFTLFLPVQAA